MVILMPANLNVVIGGVVLSTILFVASGNGVVVPKTYTHLAKAPEASPGPVPPTVVTAEPKPSALRCRHRGKSQTGTRTVAWADGRIGLRGGLGAPMTRHRATAPRLGPSP